MQPFGIAVRDTDNEHANKKIGSRFLQAKTHSMPNALQSPDSNESGITNALHKPVQTQLV